MILNHRPASSYDLEGSFQAFWDTVASAPVFDGEVAVRGKEVRAAFTQLTGALPPNVMPFNTLASCVKAKMYEPINYSQSGRPADDDIIPMNQPYSGKMSMLALTPLKHFEGQPLWALLQITVSRSTPIGWDLFGLQMPQQSALLGKIADYIRPIPPELDAWVEHKRAMYVYDTEVALAEDEDWPEDDYPEEPAYMEYPDVPYYATGYFLAESVQNHYYSMHNSAVFSVAPKPEPITIKHADSAALSEIHEYRIEKGLL